VWAEAEDPVHIRLPAGTESETQAIKKIVSFFKERGAEFFAEKDCEQALRGGLDTLKKLFGADVDDIKVSPDSKRRAPRDPLQHQEAITAAPVHEILAASGCFPGRARNVWSSIVDALVLIASNLSQTRPSTRNARRRSGRSHRSVQSSQTHL